MLKSKWLRSFNYGVYCNPSFRKNKLGKYRFQFSLKLLYPNIYYRLLEESLFKSETFGGHKAAFLILHMRQIFLISTDHIKAGGEDIERKCAEIGNRKKSNGVIPFLNGDIDGVKPLLFQKPKTLKKKLIAHGFFSIGYFRANVTDKIL